MEVDYVREDKWKLEKRQGSLFGETKEEDKVILVYKSPSYRDLLKVCVDRELPIPSEEDYHKFWGRETGGRKIRSSEFLKVKRRVHKEILGFLEIKRRHRF